LLRRSFPQPRLAFMGVAEATLRSCAAQPRSLVGSVIEEARKFVAGALEADDLTIITVRYRG
jgi:hypothetical protein